MKTQIYVIDTSAILEIFKIHPPSTYPDFWIKLEDYLISLLSNGRLIILKWVDKELTELGYSIEANDPPAVWIKKHEKYIVENSTSVVDAGKKVIRDFPNLIDPNAEKEQADPFLIGYVLHHRDTQTTFEPQEYIIITHEKLNVPLDKFCQLSEEQRKLQGKKIPTVCSWYKIRTITYLQLFKEEGWTF